MAIRIQFALYVTHEADGQKRGLQNSSHAHYDAAISVCPLNAVPGRLIKTRIDLRSSSVSTTLARLLPFLPNVATSGAGPRATTALPVMLVSTRSVLHCLVIISATRRVLDLAKLILNINLLARKQHIDNLANLLISRAEPVRLAVGVLALRLQPEQVALRAGRELKDEDAAIGRRFEVFGVGVVLLAGVGDEGAIAGDHEQVKLWVVDRRRPWAPAEVAKLWEIVNKTRGTKEGSQ